VQGRWIRRQMDEQDSWRTFDRRTMRGKCRTDEKRVRDKLEQSWTGPVGFIQLEHRR